MGAFSAHFTERELACPHCGKNECTQELVDALEALRAVLGRPVQVDSAYRCAEHNKAIGGKPQSQHLLGRAADVRCMDLDAAAMERAARLVNGIRGIGRSSPPMRYIHVDVRETPAKWCYNTAGAEVPYFPADALIT